MNADARFVYIIQVVVSMEGSDHLLVLFASLVVEGGVMANNVPIVCGSWCFPGDDCDLSLERGVGMT